MTNPPAIICSVDDLDILANQINAAHRSGEEATRKGLYFFRQVGAMLCRAKEKVPHGQWLEWLSKNAEFSRQTAQNYMRLHAERDRLATAEPTTLRDALLILTSDEESAKKPTAGFLEPDPPLATSPPSSETKIKPKVGTHQEQPTLEFDGRAVAEKEARAMLARCKEQMRLLTDQLPTLLAGPAGYDLRRLAREKGVPLAEEKKERFQLGRPGNLPEIEIREFWPTIETLHALLSELSEINFMRG